MNLRYHFYFSELLRESTRGAPGLVMEQFRGFFVLSRLVLWLSLSLTFVAFAGRPLWADTNLAKNVLDNARQLLESGEISYVYGGKQVGGVVACGACNTCLDEVKPTPLDRLVKCPACKSCGLDCSHFIERVFRDAGLPVAYLTTKSMLGLSTRTLLNRYHYRIVDIDNIMFKPADILVYKGHVVLLEKYHKKGRGDLIHATSGKDLKGPGLGIQRERQADLLNFRGPLRRVLRHRSLSDSKKHGQRKFRRVMSKDAKL